MRRIDKLILQEMFGPWLFGVAIFTVLIMAGTYLFKLTDFVVKGISLATIAELFILLIPGVMAKTFPMAVLLATLLSFGRLSSDSEIVALKAGGTSLTRIMIPVGIFGTAVALGAFLIGEYWAPGAALRATALQGEISAKLDGVSVRPTSYPIYEKDKKTGKDILKGQVTARNFSIADRTLTGVTIVAYNEKGKTSYILLAEKMRFELEKGKFNFESGWRLEGGTKLLSTDGQRYVEIGNDLWPNQVPRPMFTDDAIVAANLKDLDSFSMTQMRQRIDDARRDKVPSAQIANLEYGYWNKLSLPLAAVIYALVGAPLGIRNHRTGAAAGFWMSVIIIFGYLMLANFMAIYAQGGVVPAYVASFLPLVIGLAVAAFTIRMKNT